MKKDWNFCRVLELKAYTLKVLECKDGTYRVRKIEKLDEDSHQYKKKGVTQVYR